MDLMVLLVIDDNMSDQYQIKITSHLATTAHGTKNQWWINMNNYDDDDLDYLKLTLLKYIFRYTYKQSVEEAPFSSRMETISDK